MDKVQIKADFSNSKVSVSDLKKIYSELEGKEIVRFRGKANGTLNNFTAKKFHIYLNETSKIIGDLSFKNTFEYERGFIFDGNLENATTTYKDLKTSFTQYFRKLLYQQN